MKGNVFVIGLGLIGGSVSLAIRNTHHETIITGYDVDSKNLRLAKVLGLIDNEAETIKEGAEAADLIIIGTPVVQAESIISELSQLELKQDVLITDVGSTKKGITSMAGCLVEKGYTFIGGHPMAGSHKSGAIAAKPHLFENAFYLLTPYAGTQTDKVETLKNWLRGTKANFLVVTPELHDHLTGVISHFPHIIASGLVHQARNCHSEDQLVTRLAAGGFRDITRIASSSPEMWRDILLHNKDVILELMKEWIAEMERVKHIVQEEDADEIFAYFDIAKRFRDELPVRSQGAIPAFYDLYIDVPDYPGVISEITGYLAQVNISITNIRILETREEIYAALVVSFQTEGDRKLAMECIRKHTDYETFLT
ncbi:prephenate dehydrogenase [Peribacillus deserti]|uniref:Prephenate dehydrogenase n=1 Tax=Peribacillus deserti TaxID=673318 RepID=A0ABS2QIM2_9BACI|nr:prephenate dehydrogenase [Peribacillus deserti]MBM7692639.1 prephenate dehydrogenase [Peribacillus deserti]